MIYKFHKVRSVEYISLDILILRLLENL